MLTHCEDPVWVLQAPGDAFSGWFRCLHLACGKVFVRSLLLSWHQSLPDPRHNINDISATEYEDQWKVRSRWVVSDVKTPHTHAHTLISFLVKVLGVVGESTYFEVDQTICLWVESQLASAHWSSGEQIQSVVENRDIILKVHNPSWIQCNGTINQLAHRLAMGQLIETLRTMSHSNHWDGRYNLVWAGGSF